VGGETAVFTLSKPVSSNHQVSWCEQLEVSLNLPAAESAPLPDTCIYLFKSGSDSGDFNSGACTPISYTRILTRHVLNSSFAAAAAGSSDSSGTLQSTPFWQTLREDTATDALSDSDYPGTLLLDLALIPDPRQDTPNAQGGYESDVVVQHKKRWTALLAALAAEAAAFELRVHVYQASSDWSDTIFDLFVRYS
jgi:hypothetical protein